MRKSIRPGKLLPESMADFEQLASHPDPKIHHTLNVQCDDCGQPFSPSNMHTAAGWRETQISGICEDCFDGLFAENPQDPTYR